MSDRQSHESSPPRRGVPGRRLHLLALVTLLAFSALLGIARKEPQLTGALPSDPAGTQRAAASSFGTTGPVRPVIPPAEVESAKSALAPFANWLAAAPDARTDLATGLRLARKRAAGMRQLIQTDPDLAYQLAFTKEQWDQLPKPLQSEVEHRFAEEGRYTVHRYCFSENIDRSISTTNISHLNTHISPNLADAGDYHGTLHGVVLGKLSALVAMDGGSELIKESGDPGIAAARSEGNFKILWLNCKFSDETKWPKSNQMDMVSAELETYSYGKLSVTYDYLQVAVQMPKGIAYDTLRAEATAAAIAIDPAYNPANYDVTIYRSSTGGNWANIGGNYAHLVNDIANTAVHEIGHCMGLSHGNWWQPDPGQPSWGTGTNVLYGQDWNYMGLAPAPSHFRRDFNAPEKKILGWLEPGSDYADNVPSGIYRIYPYDSHSGNFSTAGVDAAYYGVTVFKDTKAVNLQANDRRYFLSFANMPGFDDAIYNPWYVNGLLLHWEPWTRDGSGGYNSNGPYGSTIVDAHPESLSRLGTFDGYNPAKECYDAPVQIGQTYLDNDPGNRDGEIRITPLRKNDPDGVPRSGDESIDVKVVIGDQTGNQAPTASLTLSATTVATGQSVTMTADASDPDDTELAYFWDFGLGTTGVDRKNMPLNGHPSQTYTWNTPGTYTVTVTVNDGRGGSITLTENVTVTGTALTVFKEPFLNFDAARDVPGDDTWASTSVDYSWRFDNGNQSPVTVASPKFSKLTKAYAFPAARDETNNSANFDPYDSNLSASFEFVIDADADNGVLFETGGTGSGFSLDLQNGNLRAHVSGIGGASVSTPLTVAEKAGFIHVVAVVDFANDVLQLYVDKVLRASAACTSADWSGNAECGLGGTSSAVAGGDQGDFTGQMALFRFYRVHAMPAEQVTKNYLELVGAGITIAQSGGSTDVAEGGPTDTYDIALKTQPASNVTLTPTPGAQLGVSPTTLTFTPANWNIPQTITVTAINDPVIETSPHSGTILHTATSADPIYHGILLASVSATITDNDNTPPVVHAGAMQTRYLPPDIWSPLSLSAQLWLDASDASTITLDGSSVTQWADKSGFARHASASGTNRPTATEAGLNGKRVITLDGSDDFFSVHLDFLAGTGKAHSAFIVTKPTIYNNIYGAADGNVANQSLHVGFTNSSTYRVNYWGNNYGPTITSNFVKGAANLVNFIWIPGTGKQIFANGKSEGANTSAGTIGTMAGGGRIGFTTTAYNTAFGGDIAEIVIFTGTVTPADREKTEGYLAHKWGLTSRLDPAHPHKTDNPNNVQATIQLNGSATDADGHTLTHLWTFVSGPGPVTFDDPTRIDATASATVAGSYTLRLTTSDGFTQVSHEIVITVNPPSPYGQWVAGHHLPGWLSAPGSDNDSDSLTNLQEFAFGMNPTSSARNPLSYTPNGTTVGSTLGGTPVLENTGSPSSPNYRAVFVRRKDHVPAGLTYEVQFSANLTHWEPVLTNPTVLTGANQDLIETVAVPFPATVPLVQGGESTATPKFFRVAVSMP